MWPFKKYPKPIPEGTYVRAHDRTYRECAVCGALCREERMDAKRSVEEIKKCTLNWRFVDGEFICTNQKKCSECKYFGIVDAKVKVEYFCKNCQKPKRRKK